MANNRGMQATLTAKPKNLQQELGKKNPFELPEEESYLNLLRTAEALTEQYRTLLSSHGLSEPQYNALRIVAARGEKGIPSQAIAADMVTKDPDMTRLVDRLEKAGLVDRHRCEQDRRRIWVRITPKGSAMLTKLKRPLQQKHHEVLGHLGTGKLARLSKLLFEARHP